MPLYCLATSNTSTLSPNQKFLPMTTCRFAPHSTKYNNYKLNPSLLTLIALLFGTTIFGTFFTTPTFT